MWIIAVPLVVGVGVALYEWRRKKTLLPHDFNQASATQSEADRELDRTSAAIRDRTIYGNLE